MEEFRKLGISEDVILTLKKKGFTKPTDIQKVTIPILMQNNCDVIAQAQTGTGKTAAFALPLIEHLEETKDIQAIILAPTRELVIQVCEEINSIKGKKKLSVVPIYGGQSIDIQLRKLKQGVSIVVGTPGRVLDHINRKTLKLNKIKYFILDEADEMLNMGFIEDIEKIFNYTPKDKRVFLFSATMPEKIKKLAKKYMGKYEFIKTERELTTGLTEQVYYQVLASERLELLCRIIDMNDDFYGLVFCQTKLEVDKLANNLSERGYKAEPIHGDLTQSKRERTLSRFRNKKINILIATDVAARGIDITDLTHVINYSVPQNPEIYIHRIGRTGRAGKKGTAITFVTESETGKINIIKRVIGKDLKKLPLPKLKQIVTEKKKKLVKKVEKLIEENGIDSYIDFAEELMKLSDSKKVIAALLKYSLGNVFDLNKKHEFSKFKTSNKEKVRLFIAKGRKDRLGKRELVEFISKETGTSPKLIDDVKVFDEFSFITVPKDEAEIILYKFKSVRKGRRPLVDKAKEKRI